MLTNLVALASPGPAFIALSHSAINETRTEVLAFGLGLALTATLWCGLALYGLTAFFKFVPWLYTAMKLAGGVYLIYLATKIWRGATARLPETGNTPKHGAKAFLSGCAINLTNPKAVLFASSILLAIFPMNITWPQKILIMSTMFAVEALFFSALVFWLSQPTTRNAYLYLKRWIDRSAAAVLGGLGLNFLLPNG